MANKVSLINITRITSTDVPVEHWAHEYVTTLAGLEVIEGYPGGTFNPRGELTIAKCVTMVIRGVMVEHPTYYLQEPATDHWASPYIETAHALSIYFDTDLAEGQTIGSPATRAQMAVMIDHAIKDGNYTRFKETGREGSLLSGLYGYEEKFSDVYEGYKNGTVTGPEIAAITHLYMLGIVDGYPDGTFGYSGTITRAETAAIIFRFINRAELEPGAFPGKPEEPDTTPAQGPGEPPEQGNERPTLDEVKEVGLPDNVAGRYPSQLSGGQRQRVVIAAALATSPRLLIADEATTALDVITQKEILDLIDGIRTQRAMPLIIITHNIRLAKQRTDRIFVMADGGIAETGGTREVIADPKSESTKTLLEADRFLRNSPYVSDTTDTSDTYGNSGTSDTSDASGTSDIDITDSSGTSDTTDTSDTSDASDTSGTSGTSRTSDTSGTSDTTDASGTSGQSVTSGQSDTSGTSKTSDTTTVASSGSGGDMILSAKGLTKSFGKIKALEDVNIEIRAGECVGVAGQSGSGKTTLARCLTGLTRPDSGAVSWFSPVRPQIVFQDPYSSLNPAHSVRFILEEALQAADRPKSELEELLSLVEISASLLDRKPSELSGGQQQRVAIARALAPRPALLICDESVSALDLVVQNQILTMLERLRKERQLSILFITHDLSVLRMVAGRVYVMNRARIVESGTAEEIFESPREEYTKRLIEASS